MYNSRDTQAAIQNGAIAVLYDLLNGVDTNQFYFSIEEVEEAEKQYASSSQYSVELLEGD